MIPYEWMGYREYLRTPHWRAKRLEALNFYEWRCVRCRVEGGLEIHHRVYFDELGSILGREDVAEHLLAVCRGCHQELHREEAWMKGA